jgi:hypothetical protein
MVIVYCLVYLLYSDTTGWLMFRPVQLCLRVTMLDQCANGHTIKSCLSLHSLLSARLNVFYIIIIIIISSINVIIIVINIIRCPQIFQKSRSHLQILGARRVTWSKMDTEDPQFWSDLPLSAAFCSMHGNWYTFSYVRTNNAKIMLKILGATVQKLVPWLTKQRIFAFLMIIIIIIILIIIITVRQFVLGK